jgi:hypothetical protein
VATSRNEGINKVVKRGLSLKSNFLKVVQTVHARLEAQDTKTGFADMKASIDFTGFSRLTAHIFKPVHEMISNNCSEYALGKFIVQAALGVGDYTLRAELVGECPENSPEHGLRFAGHDWPESNLNTVTQTSFDMCSHFRSGTITEYVAKHVHDKNFVCYAVAHLRAPPGTAPQIVVLHGKHEAAANNMTQYMKFFCTCGFSVR